MFPEHQGGEWLVDRRTGKPEERFPHFDGIVKLNRKPLGRSAWSARRKLYQYY